LKDDLEKLKKDQKQNEIQKQKLEANENIIAKNAAVIDKIKKDYEENETIIKGFFDKLKQGTENHHLSIDEKEVAYKKINEKIKSDDSDSFAQLPEEKTIIKTHILNDKKIQFNGEWKNGKELYLKYHFGTPKQVEIKEFLDNISELLYLKGHIGKFLKLKSSNMSENVKQILHNKATNFLMEQNIYLKEEEGITKFHEKDYNFSDIKRKYEEIEKFLKEKGRVQKINILMRENEIEHSLTELMLGILKFVDNFPKQDIEIKACDVGDFNTKYKTLLTSIYETIKQVENNQNIQKNIAYIEQIEAEINRITAIGAAADKTSYKIKLIDDSKKYAHVIADGFLNKPYIDSEFNKNLISEETLSIHDSKFRLSLKDHAAKSIANFNILEEAIRFIGESKAEKEKAIGMFREKIIPSTEIFPLKIVDEAKNKNITYGYYFDEFLRIMGDKYKTLIEDLKTKIQKRKGILDKSFYHSATADEINKVEGTDTDLAALIILDRTKKDMAFAELNKNSAKMAEMETQMKELEDAKKLLEKKHKQDEDQHKKDQEEQERKRKEEEERKRKEEEEKKKKTRKRKKGIRGIGKTKKKND